MLSIKRENLVNSQLDYLVENSDALMKVLPSIIDAHRYEFALMRNGYIIRYFLTQEAAQDKGKKLYTEGCYVVATIEDTPKFKFPSDPDLIEGPLREGKNRFIPLEGKVGVAGVEKPVLN